ncbi:hypothetical protein NO932_06550 [Pelagibacterium sp. 26DY04]|uniref:hypothetical protein n=1 Tax=Pelagibacterium sp. 26DY04 TaxID=2967130 RepID=UPI0028160114|nr:hypothetical protein [Pelagibacterium sp. 26DY04]WMT88265.1 hypothetical protein NO932_06550 [Pelagibacterium sp. 26DY04]
MDKGEFAKVGYEVQPGMNGSYVLIAGTGFASDRPTLRPMIGFTNWSDLMAFLREDHRALAQDFGPQQPDE